MSPSKNIYLRTGIICLSFLLCLLVRNNSYGQLNLKIGYNLNYSTYPINNALLENFNSEREWLSEKFKPLHISNALVVGARLKSEFVGLDVTWEDFQTKEKLQAFSPMV